MMEGLEFAFYSSMPGIPLWCPVEGCVGDVALLSSHYISDPSPLPSHDDGVHAVLVTASKKMLVGDGLGPEYSEDSSKVLGGRWTVC